MKPDRGKDFAARLRALRGDTTLRVWSKQIGINVTEWNAYELGRKKPSFNKLVTLCCKTGCSPNYLLFGVETVELGKKARLRLVRLK